MALRSFGRHASSRLLVRATTKLPEITSYYGRLHQKPTSMLPPAASRHHGQISFSTMSSFSPFTWFQNRQEEKSAEKFREQMEQMANKEVWTLADMNAGVEEATKSWLAKIPGLNNSKEMEMATQMKKVVDGVMQVAGSDATISDLEKLGRADKLRAALAAEATEEEVNGLILQFQAMSLMQRVVRKRKLDGKPIPQTSQNLEAIIQVDGPKFLTKSQKTKFSKQAAQNMLRKSRRR